jgi:hypothetical protein
VRRISLISLLIFIFHLVEFETFEEWNPDPEIAVQAFYSSALALYTNGPFHCQGAARRLYGHVHNLELYVCPLIVHWETGIDICSCSRVFRQNLPCR